MSVYDQIHKAYSDSLKNNFWDAWGVVASPTTIYELKGEVLRDMAVYRGKEEIVETIFGLVLIPCEICERDKVYIVDEEFGKTILGMNREEQVNERIHKNRNAF